MRSLAIWLTVVLAMSVPVAAAAFSPLLAWRDPVYIVAGFAGAGGLSLLLLQPLLAVGYLPGLKLVQTRRIHRWIGVTLVFLVVIHVLGLWLTSPPDVVDALLFVSPTPFSVWGVIAMWGVFATALLAASRRRLRIRPATWRLTHKTLGVVVVAGTVIHALLIEGTMEVVSKTLLCICVLAVTTLALARPKQRR